MNWAAVGQFVIAVGMGGVIVAIIQNIISPKTRAEARQIAASVAQKTVDQSLQALEIRARATKNRAETAEHRADESDVKADEAVAQVRRMTDVLWQCASYMRRVDSVLTPEQQAKAGPAPDLSPYFR